MKQDRENSITNDPDQLSKDLLNRMELQFPSRKEQAWDRLSGMIDSREEPPVPRNRPDFIFRMLPFAAAILIFLVVGTTLRFYNRTITAQEVEAYLLPDGSSVQVTNGEVKYYPYWWNFERKLVLDGEASFKVTKGNTFQVRSEQGTTEVLGTSFQISTLNRQYSVACYTGSVKVTSRISNVSAILTPNEQALVDETGKFAITLIDSKEEQAEPMSLYLTFKGEPLADVFRKIEQLYGLIIVMDGGTELKYSGNFKTNSEPESIIRSICIPLDLAYEKKPDGSYILNPPENSMD